jgi:hypothetical protein
MARACALGLGDVAVRLASGDHVERGMWADVLGRADQMIAAMQDEEAARYGL